MKTIQLITLAAGLIFSTLNSQAQSTPFLTNGLVAYYPFNGNANDASGNGNDGILNNVIFAADRFGNPNAAASFAGDSSSYITVNTTNLNLQPPFTVSVWINPTVSLGTDGPRILSTAGYEIGVSYPAGENLASTNRYIGMNVTDANDIGTNVDSPILIPTGTWNQGVAVWTTNGGTLYVNGVMVASYSTLLLPDYSRGFVPTIGRNSGSSHDSYGGLIDDLAIYNRALSPQEISALYEAFSTGIITLPTITIAGPTNQNYSIQYITNLSFTNWTTLVSNIVLQGFPYLYPDTNSVGQAQRFYRVVAQ